MSNRPMQNKIVLVSGGTRGIGLAICRRLAEQGANVVSLDLSGSDSTELRATIEGLGQRCLVVEGDVSVAADWQAAVAATLAEFGRIDILVNNAGISGFLGSLMDYPDDAFDKIMAVNTRGVFLGMKYVAPKLIETGGSIINISSISGLGGGQRILGYTASKHAVVGMTLGAAAELGRKGVRVNAVCPAPIETDMTDQLAITSQPDDPDAFTRAFKARLPMGRYGDPVEVVNVVAFLAGPEASFVNGAIIPVDGGARAG